jgi:hypothetical protein
MGYPALGLLPRAGPGTPLGPVSGANAGFADTEKTFIPQRQGGMPFLPGAGPDVLGSLQRLLQGLFPT